VSHGLSEKFLSQTSFYAKEGTDTPGIGSEVLSEPPYAVSGRYIFSAV